MRLAALACAALLVATQLALALPLRKPTARPGYCTDKMKSEIKAADRLPKGQGYGIIFYGDSIVESLRGTDKCGQCDKLSTRSSCAGVPDVLSKYFKRYHVGVQGMSMDQTANLQYRLQHGQVPSKNKPRVVVLLIGTNDLTETAWSATDQRLQEMALAKEAPLIAKRIERVVMSLRAKLPHTELLLLGILPRGTGTGKGLLSAQNDLSWPSHYAKAIADINGRIKKLADKTRYTTFLDCGSIFIKRGGRAIDSKLMPDALHPNAAGWAKLARCMAPAVRKLYS